MINEIKDRIQIEDLLVRLGVQINESGFIHSIFKEEKTPSLKIYSDSNRFYDFSTSKGGDVIDFYSEYYKIDTKTAIKELTKMFGITKDSLKRKERILIVKKPEDSLEQIERELFEERAGIMEFDGGLSRKEAERYALQDVMMFRAGTRKRVLQAFCEFETIPGDVEKYLTERGLNEETTLRYNLFGIADPSRTISYLKSIFNQYELETSGLFRNNYFIFTHHKIIIPYMEQGQIVFMKARNQHGVTPKYKGLSGVSAKRFYNIDVLSKTKKIFVVEGEFDAIKFMQDTGEPAVAVSGVGNIPDLDCLKGKIVYLLFDNDEAGDAAGEKLFENLKQLNIEVHLLKINGNAKDISELL